MRPAVKQVPTITLIVAIGKTERLILIASSLDASSGAVVNVNTGGVFSVENLNLQGAEKHALILNGGAVETTLNQIFVGEGEKAAVGIEQKILLLRTG